MNLKHLFTQSVTQSIKIGATISIASMLLIAPISSSADILNLGSHPKLLTKANAPRAGMSMKSVLKRYGKPTKRRTAPGKVTSRNPRITTWNYGKTIVYFENKHVIHTVIRR